MSIRRIAEQVFGSAGLRGRVERILRAPARAVASARPPGPLLVDGVDFESLSNAQQLRLLVDWHRRALLEAEKAPTSKGLAALLRLEVMVTNLEQVERMNAATRERRRGRVPA